MFEKRTHHFYPLITMETTITSLKARLADPEFPAIAKQNVLLTNGQGLIAEITATSGDMALTVYCVLGEGPDPVPTSFGGYMVIDASGQVLSEGSITWGTSKFNVPKGGHLTVIGGLEEGCKAMIGWGRANG